MDIKFQDGQLRFGLGNSIHQKSSSQSYADIFKVSLTHQRKDERKNQNYNNTVAQCNVLGPVFPFCVFVILLVLLQCSCIIKYITEGERGPRTQKNATINENANPMDSTAIIRHSLISIPFRQYLQKMCSITCHDHPTH